MMKKPKGKVKPKEEMMNPKTMGKGKKSAMSDADKKKKAAVKIDIMLMKAMPGIPMSKGKKSGAKKVKY